MKNKMKILIVSQYYWPENSRVTEIAEILVDLGNSVTILTGLPNYPQGYIYEGYKKVENRAETHNSVDIIRSKLIERRHDIIHRFLNYYSFPFYANKIAKKLPEDFDVVLAMEESPIMLVRPAITYAKKNNKKILMYEMDLWPESILAGGIKKDSFIYKHYKKVACNIYSQMDKILVSTREHIKYIRSLPKCENLDIDYLPQFSESIFEKCNKKNHDNFLNFLFAGNLGKAQNLTLIIDAANLLKNDSSVKFHFVGDGIEKNNLELKAKKLGLNNVIFHGSKPIEEMPKYYEMADVMIVTLEDRPYANFTIPGKVQTYMAASRPILSAAKGSTNNLIREADCGIAIDELTPECFAEACLKFKESFNLNRFAENSKKFYKEHFTKEKFVDKLIYELKSLAK